MQTRANLLRRKIEFYRKHLDTGRLDAATAELYRNEIAAAEFQLTKPDEPAGPSTSPSR